MKQSNADFLVVYTQNRDLGLQCLLLMSDQNNIGQDSGAGSYKGYGLHRMKVQEWDSRLGGAVSNYVKLRLLSKIFDEFRFGF